MLEMWNLFIHAIKYLPVQSSTTEQPGDLVCGKLLNKVKCHETVVADYHHDRETHLGSAVFL